MQAKNLIKLLQLLVLVALARFPPDCHCTKLGALRELNEFLSGIETDTVAGYLEAINQELDRLNSVHDPLSTDQQVVFDRFVKLGNLIGNIECNYDEFKLIKEMHFYGQDYTIENAREQGDPPPTDMIIFRVCRERAEKCINVWPTKYMEAHSNYEDKNTLKWAEYKAEAFKEKRRQLQNNDREYIKYLMNYKSISDPNMIEDACKHLIRCSKNNPNGRNFNLMYRTYLQIPCFKFREDFYNPYLQQARYDSESFDDPESKLFNLNKSEYIPFYEGFAHKEACNNLHKPEIKGGVYNHWLQLQSGNDYAESSNH